MHLRAPNDHGAAESSCFRGAQAFKVKAVTAHMDRLLRLADDATLRSELTLFGLARDAEQPVQEEHRAGTLVHFAWVAACQINAQFVATLHEEGSLDNRPCSNMLAPSLMASRPVSQCMV